MYRYQTYFADVIRGAGVTVVEVTDPVDGLPWQQHAAKQAGERVYAPVGVVNHHTASVRDYPDLPWYPVAKLRLKCNINIKPDGVAYIVSAGYQYDSGYGDRDVLDAIILGTPRPDPSDTYRGGRPGGPNPGELMNPWFIDIECDHPGDGRDITLEQYNALVKTDAAILTYNAWPVDRLVGHKELSRRKIDPYWNQDREAMDRIRYDVKRLLEEDTVWIRDIDDATWTAWYRNGHISGNPDVLPDYYFTSTVSTSDTERVHAFNAAQQSIAKRSSISLDVETIEVVKTVRAIDNI